MVNEQIKTILNKLDGLVQENPDLVASGISIEQFINECKDNNSPLSAIVNCLLETIREKDEVIQSQNQKITNLQVQTQGIHSRLRRKSSHGEGIISPLIASPTGYFPDRPSPRRLSNGSDTSSPRELEEVLEMVDEKEELAIAQEEELNTLRQKVSLLQNQLEQQNKTILSLETGKQKGIQHQETNDNKIKELQRQVSQFQTEIKKQEQRIKELVREQKESDDDYHQLGQQKDRLKELLQVEKATNKRLEEQLAKEVNENQCLKEAQNKTNKQLFEKFNELARVKKLAVEEKKSLQQIINDQAKKYKQESEERESEYRKKMEHLMLLQVADKKIAH
jgi:chromosome segregation ATPase